jgi:hypothetical protein
VRHLLRTGRADAAEDVLKPERARAPGDISLWALTDVVWRLLADERAAWLSGQPGFVATTALALERADLERIAATLRGLHLPRAQPIGQSVRGGTQTRGRLFDRADPTIRQLRDAVQAALGVYLAGLPPADEEHPLLRHRDRALRIEGSWSVRLVDEGYHVAHLHPAGVLSSACHLVVPALDSSSCEGWLELGRPPADLMLDLAPLKIVEPRAGGLILFPSYLYHGTRPFRAGERLTVAFDAA